MLANPRCANVTADCEGMHVVGRQRSFDKHNLTMASTLFAADQFTETRPRFGHCTKTTEAALKRIVDANYRSLGELTSAAQIGPLGIEQAHTKDANSLNFHVAFAAAEYLLKIVLRPDILADLNQQIAICRWLYERGLPVAEPIASDHGDDIIDLDGELSGKIYMLRFVEGEYFSGAQEEIATTARAVGGLMDVLASLPPKLSLNRFRPPYFEDREIEYFEHLQASRDQWTTVFGPNDASVLAACWETIERDFHEISGSLTMLNSQPSQTTHFDLHPHNMLLQDGKIVALLDFDACYQLPAALGIGFSASKLLKRVATSRQQAPRPGTLADDVYCFFQAMAESNPRNGGDRNLLRLFAKAETLRRLLSVCRRKAAGMPQVWHGISTHAPALEEIDILFDG
jgi:Ser/Thr protein kinase RdoA (MazF antagonist)